MVFLCNTYHHIEGREAYFRAVLDLLAPGGRLVIVDFRPEAERGPPASHKIAPAQVDAELLAVGLELADAWDGLPDQFLRVYTR